MNLVTLLEQRASQHPERPALIDSGGGRDRIATYHELFERTERRAGAFRNMGLTKGQTLMVFQPVSIELYEILLAAFQLGIQVMLVDPSAGRKFLSQCCKRLLPDAFVGSWKAQWLRGWVPELRKISCAVCTQGWFPRSQSWANDAARVSIVRVDDETPALITFTSGSTGVPKAAVRTHGFLLAQHAALSKAMHFEEAEVDLITLPVFVLANLASGLTSVLAATDLARPGSPDVTAVSAQCKRFHVTRCAASPAFFEALGEKVPQFKKIYTGGAPVFPDLLRNLGKWQPDAEIYSVYGSTEAEPIAHFPANRADAESEAITCDGGGLCSGWVVPELNLAIITNQSGRALGPLSNEELERIVVTPGQAGELIVSGDHVLKGYLAGIGDQETKISTADKVWHRTGDVGWQDERGRLWLLGRAAEKMPYYQAAVGLPEQAWCYPFAIECAMRAIFPKVRMAALDLNGERTLVVGMELRERQQREIMAASKRFGIRQLCFLKVLPLDRRHQAKIDYPSLRGLLAKSKMTLNS